MLNLHNVENPHRGNITLYHTFIVPNILFNTKKIAKFWSVYGQLWMPPPGQKLEKMERLLKRWTSRIPTLRNLNYWQRLIELKMYSEQRRLERYRAIYVWKVLQGLVPNHGVF